MVSYIWMELTVCLLFTMIPWWETDSIMASDADGLSVTATIYCAITLLILFDFVMTEGVRLCENNWREYLKKNSFIFIFSFNHWFCRQIADDKWEIDWIYRTQMFINLKIHSVIQLVSHNVLKQYQRTTTSLQAGSPECRALLAETLKSSKEVIIKTMRRYSVATTKKSAMLCKVTDSACLFIWPSHRACRVSGRDWWVSVS